MKTLPISESPLNHYAYRLEFRTGDQYKAIYLEPFKRHHYLISFRNGQELENINRTLKKIINPANLYGIYFHNKDIEFKFTSLCLPLFDNSVKFVKYNNAFKTSMKETHNNVPFSGPLLSKRPFEVIHIDTFSFEKSKFLTIIDLLSK